MAELNYLGADGSYIPLALIADSWDLVWANASPGSAFAPQTISLDLSGYDLCAVIVSFLTTDDFNSIFMCEIGKKTVAYVISSSTNGVTIRSRSLTPTPTGISFEGGILNNKTVSDGADNNSSCVPQKVLGIKMAK